MFVHCSSASYEHPETCKTNRTIDKRQACRKDRICQIINQVSDQVRTLSVTNYIKYKNAFQWDAYYPLQWSSRGGGGEVCSERVSAWGCRGQGVCVRGCLPREGWCVQRGRGVCLEGVSASECLIRGGCTPPRQTHTHRPWADTGHSPGKHPSGHTLLPIACWGTCPVNRITDRCKNITFPQLHFLAVIIISAKFV